MSDQFGSRHQPEEITVHKAEKVLEVRFDDGFSTRLPAELLRVESPSAEVQGHGPDQKTLVAGRQHVAIIEIEPVGNYAVKLVFDDLHDSGIYTWDYLYWLGQNQERVWADYLTALEVAGKSRDPRQNPPEPPAAHAHKGGGCG